MDNLFKYFIDIKDALDYQVIENIMNIIACAIENRMIMNENSFETSLLIIVEALGNYIFNN